MKKLLKVIGIIILGAVLIFCGIFSYFKILRAQDFKLQREYMETLRAKTPEAHDEQSIVAFPLDADVRLNEIQLIASHNSYKKLPTKLGMFFVSFYDKEEPAKLTYEHSPLYRQLDHGARSVELDVRKRGKRLELCHIPLVDSRATAPDFALALEEIKIWSDNNPGHVPLMIQLELKSDWEQIDPWLHHMDKDILDEIDAAIRAVFPEEQMITPDDVRTEGKSLEQSITEDGWPELQDTLGQVMFVMLPKKEFRELYHEDHENLEGRVIFTSAKEAGLNAVVIYCDTPDVERMQDWVKQNYIVRTRADAYMRMDEERVINAKASGAHIIASDFTPGEAEDPSGYVCTFEDGMMVRLNPVLQD